MTLVDHVKEHVGGVGAVAEMTDLVDYEDVGVEVSAQVFAQAPNVRGGGQIVDELGGGRKESSEAELDGAVGDGNSEMSFASASFTQKDQVAPLGDHLGAEVRAQELRSHGALQREVVVVDGLEKGEVRGVRGAAQACLLPLGDLLGDQYGEEDTARPLLGLGALAELAPVTTRVGQVQALEERIEINSGGIEGHIVHHCIS